MVPEHQHLTTEEEKWRYKQIVFYEKRYICSLNQPLGNTEKDE